MREQQLFYRSSGAARAALLAGVILGLSSLLAGCNRQGQPATAAAAAAGVRRGIPTPGMVTDYEEFTGHIEALNSIAVEAMVPGRLEKVLFTEGAMVKQDQPLFQIDPLMFQAQYDQAVANVLLAKAASEPAGS